MKPIIRITPLVKASGIRAVQAELGDGEPVASSDGGWEFIQRPKATGFTSWGGVDPYTMTLPLMLNGFRDDTTMEHEFDALRKIQRTLVGPEKQPSPVSVSGPVPLTNFTWVIQSITPKEQLRRSSDGHRVRIQFEVTLLQFVEVDVILSLKPSPAKAAAARAKLPPVGKDATKLSAAEEARLRKLGWFSSPKDGVEWLYPKGTVLDKNGQVVKKTASSARTYTVKSGDTLVSISTRVYGNYKRADDIKKLNNIRDPKKLKVGQVLRLP